MGVAEGKLAMVLVPMDHGCGKAEVRRGELTTGINYYRIEWEATR